MADRPAPSSGSSRGPASKLYPSLSFLEISVYTATWICGVMYALYNLYRASMEQVSPFVLSNPGPSPNSEVYSPEERDWKWG